MAIIPEPEPDQMLYQSLIENIPGAIYRSTPEDERTMISMSAEIEIISGYPAADFIHNSARPYTAVIHPDDRPYVSNALREGIRLRQRVSIDYRIVDATHAVRWVNDRAAPVYDGDGRPQWIDGIILDISDRRKIADDLQTNEERLRLAMLAARQGWFDLNVQTGAVIVSPEYALILGYEPEEFATSMQEWLDGIHPDDQEAVVTSFNECIASGETITGEYRRRTKDGTWKWIRSIGKIVEYDQGARPLRMTGTHADISERKQLEEDLRQAHKMEALGTLAGGIAHDFNNILSAIMGYTELTCLQIPDGGPIRQNLKKVLRSCRRARDLVKQILLFSRKDPHEHKPLEISLVIREVCDLLRATLPATVEIRTAIDPDAGTVMADPVQMHQLLLNLCTNAADAMRTRGGLLDLTLQPVDGAGGQGCAEKSDGPLVRLTVSDTGEGIAPEHIDKIFDPFFTTKKQGKGTGMGLAVVHGIVKSHGGAIHVESAPGAGATFQVVLPRIDGEETADEPLERQPPGGSERVLVVDDEPLLVEMCEQMLGSLGYRVTGTTSSIDALDMFRKTPNAFDLVLTDHTMPRLTGYELAKQLLRIRPDIPVVLCTGFSETVNPDRAMAAGIRAFVMKPYDHAKLAREVRSVLNKNLPLEPKNQVMFSKQ